MYGGGYVHPASYETVDNRMHAVYQGRKSVFKAAVSSMSDAIARRMKVLLEKVMINIEKYGNTSAGTISICLEEREEQLKKDDNIILAVFGAGSTWGTLYYKMGI